MAKKTKRTIVAREKAGDYASAGEQFFQAAGLAREYEYWNAAGLLYVHSAIALADAVAIARRGEKSTSENHMDALALFEEALEKVKGKSEQPPPKGGGFDIRQMSTKDRASHAG